MAPLRIRYSKGTTNIDVDLDAGTVLDLQQAILKATQILPSQQEVKLGYPPQPLVLIPELPISSLGIKRGDQLTVNEKKGATPTSIVPPSVPAAPIPDPIPQAATPPAAAPVPRQPASTGPVTISTPSGILVHQVVSDDNSCLFTSIGVVFNQDTAAAQKLRQVVADAIREDVDHYSEAVLGRPREEYIQTILKPSTWGGAIELAIFANKEEIEVSSIDIETGRVDRFGEGKYDQRVILLYSGIHYDAVTLSPDPDLLSHIEFHTTKFSVSDTSILDAAQKLASELRRKKKFTNTATFDLKCEICGKGLKGEKEARAHASQTGHTAFGEY